MRQVVAEDEEEGREGGVTAGLQEWVSMSRRDIGEGSEFVHQQPLPRLLSWRYAQAPLAHADGM